VHEHPDIPLWGCTCPNSTWSARLRLFARRAGLVTFGTCVVVPIVVVFGVSAVVVWVTYTAAGYLVSAVYAGAEQCVNCARRGQRRRRKRACCC
jgi:hypothetical protein